MIQRKITFAEPIPATHNLKLIQIQRIEAMCSHLETLHKKWATRIKRGLNRQRKIKKSLKYYQGRLSQLKEKKS